MPMLADGDRNAEPSNANKSFADRRAAAYAHKAVIERGGHESESRSRVRVTVMISCSVSGEYDKMPMTASASPYDLRTIV
jgi:hypothetical protein